MAQKQVKAWLKKRKSQKLGIYFKVMQGLIHNWYKFPFIAKLVAVKVTADSHGQQALTKGRGKRGSGGNSKQRLDL